jgi:hypothetical protein
MAHDIQTMLGYHGQEIRFYDELLGGKGQWRFAGSPSLLDLLSVRFVLIPEAQAVPGYHQVLGPVETTPGSSGVLLERDTVAPYARVMAGAAKLAEDQIVPTLIDPRFYDRLALYSDTAGVSPEDPTRLMDPGADPPRSRTGRRDACASRSRGPR